MKYAILVVLVSTFVLSGCGNGGGGSSSVSVPITATNNTATSTYAEGDNVNVPITGLLTSFVIEATHPVYNIAGGNCNPDFSGGSSAGDPVYDFTPTTYKLFDNGTKIFDAVREAHWWRPTGMDVSLNGGTPKKDIHYVRLYRKIANVASWPQFLVLYSDGNLRLKPHPQGTTDNCFGSSVIIGPAAVAKRPFTEIATANYVSSKDMLEIGYKDGSSATIHVEEVNRTHAVVRATFNTLNALPLVTFRSMFVALGNCDIDHVKWTDTAGTLHDDLVSKFVSGESTSWLFHRSAWSNHNTSAPDIRIGQM